MELGAKRREHAERGSLTICARGWCTGARCEGKGNSLVGTGAGKSSSFSFPSEISIDVVFELNCQYIDKPEELAVVNVPTYGRHRGSARPTGNTGH